MNTRRRFIVHKDGHRGELVPMTYEEFSYSNLYQFGDCELAFKEFCLHNNYNQLDQYSDDSMLECSIEWGDKDDTVRYITILDNHDNDKEYYEIDQYENNELTVTERHYDYFAVSSNGAVTEYNIKSMDTNTISFEKFFERFMGGNKERYKDIDDSVTNFIVGEARMSRSCWKVTGDTGGDFVCKEFIIINNASTKQVISIAGGHAYAAHIFGNCELKFSDGDVDILRGKSKFKQIPFLVKCVNGLPYTSPVLGAFFLVINEQFLE